MSSLQLILLKERRLEINIYFLSFELVNYLERHTFYYTIINYLG